MSENTHRKQVAQDLLDWIVIAREIVEDHFPAERNERHNMLIVETARTLMDADRLSRIESLLAGIAASVVVEPGQN